MLIYAFDPLCGWCYAMADVLDAVAARRPLPPTRIVCGGLVTGGRVGPIAQHRGYLEQGMAAVEARTPTRFGAAFRQGLLAEGTWVADSEPACRAVLEAQALAPERAVAFAHGLTRAHYRDGLRPDTPETLRAVASQAGVDPEALLARWDTDDARARTGIAFAEARAQGFSSYPSLAWDDGGRVEAIVAGLPSVEGLARTLEARMAGGAA